MVIILVLYFFAVEVECVVVEASVTYESYPLAPTWRNVRAVVLV